MCLLSDKEFVGTFNVFVDFMLKGRQLQGLNGKVLHINKTQLPAEVTLWKRRNKERGTTLMKSHFKYYCSFIVNLTMRLQDLTLQTS